MSSPELRDSLIRQVHVMACMEGYNCSLNGFGSPKATPHGVALKYGVGKICKADEWPDIKHGLPKACYRNAYKLLRRNPRRFIYTEGFALKADVGIEIYHAWVLDKQRNYEVVDPTWSDTNGAVYIGIPFLPDFVLSRWGKHRHFFCILQAHWEDYPVLRLPAEQWLHPEAHLIPRDFTIPENMPDPTVAFEKVKQNGL